MVTVGYPTVDIGTDHAYIPIYLVKNQLVPRAIAMDINEGPLRRAREHVIASGLSGQVVLRLSDGLRALEPGEAKSAILAGMGGGLAIRILSDCRETASGLSECILQPQSEIAKVRAFLLGEGFTFLQEDMVLEDGKFYPVMKVRPPVREVHIPIDWTQTELQYGKLLLEGRNRVLKQFLEKEILLKRRIMGELDEQKSCRAKERIEELRLDLQRAEKGLGYYAL